MQPGERPDQLRGEPDTVGINLEATLVDLAVAGGDIKIPAGGSGEEDSPGLVFNLLEAAGAALMADILPAGRVRIGKAHDEEHT
jgi:hypothetical protein